MTRVERSAPVAARPAPDAPPASLRKAARVGARVGLLVGLGQQLISVGTTLVLVRILSPADVGLAALAAVVVGFAGLLTAGGFGQIIVKRSAVDDDLSSTVFWSAAGVGVVVSAAIIAAAEPLARFSGQPAAGGLVRVLAPTVLIGLISSVPRGLLQRRLQFVRLYCADLSAMIVYATVQIGLAVAGAGASAIVVGQLASAATTLLVSATLARWRPRAVFDWSAARSEARFSGGTLANTGVTYLTKNADNWAVSRTFPAAALGVYYVAYVLPNILRQRLTWIATDVLLPVFARLVDDPERGRRAYRDALGLHAFVGFPLMAGVAALAPQIVAVFFGSAWAAAAGPLRLLALAALAEFVTQAATTVFIAHGIPGRNAVIKAWSVAVLIVGLVVTTRHGLTAVAGAVLVASVTAAVVSQVLITRQLGFRLRAGVAAIRIPAVAATAMAAVVVCLARAVGTWPAWMTLAALVPVGGVVYLSLGFALDRAGFVRQLGELRSIALPRRRPRHDPRHRARS